MTKKLTTIISYLFHPVFMPILGMALILFSGTYLSLLAFESKKAILIITGMFTILLPLSVLPFLKYYKLITSYTIPQRQERLIPFIMSLIFYSFAYALFRKLGVPFFLQHFIIAALVCLFLNLIIHLWWKISAHMIGIGGLLGLLSALSFLFNIDIQLYLMIIIIAAGLIGSSRLYLKSHSQSQIYAGFMLGYVTTFLVLIILN